MSSHRRYWHKTNLLSNFIFLALSIGALSANANAQTSVWTNDSNDNRWSSSANWTTPPSQSSDVSFNLNGDVLLSSSRRVHSLTTFGSADQNFINTSNGEIVVESGEDSIIWGAASFSELNVRVGPGYTGGAFPIKGSLSILDGTCWTTETQVQVGNKNGLGLVVVDGKDSKFIANSSLFVGGIFSGNGGILIFDNAYVGVLGFASIASGSAVGVHRGDFYFDTLKLSDAPRIVGSSGTIYGDLVDQPISGDFDLSTIAGFFDDDLDWTQVKLLNRNQTVGATVINTSFRNAEEGIVQVPANPPLHFLGYVANYGTITQEENGTLQTDILITNESTGNVDLKGNVIATHGVLNDGHMEFNGANTNIFGRFENLDEGTLRVGTNKRVTFYEDFINNGPALTIAAGGRSVFLGPASGISDFQGDGLLVFADEFTPGDDAETVEFRPHTIFGDGSTINIDIGGPTNAEFDRLLFANDVSLNGMISIELIDFYQFQSAALLVAGAPDIQLGSSFSIIPPPGYTASHSIVEENGSAWLRVELTVVPDLTIAPESVQITRGVLATGTEAELAISDNTDLSIRRSPQSVQSIVQFIVNSTSPYSFPNEFRLRVESSVFARTTVNLKIEAFNFATDQYELLATETATRFADRTFEHALPNDPTHYLDPNGEMTARITFESLVARQRFSANIDQVVWVIEK